MTRAGSTRSSVAVALLLLAACSHAAARTRSSSGVPDPPHTVKASPDYTQACAPSGPDSSLTCLEVTLAAIDHARAQEGVGSMRLPADFDHLSVPQQLLVALDAERVDRGLPPLAGLSAALSAVAEQGAAAARVPPPPGRPYESAHVDWVGAAANGLDADYLLMYDDGPGSGVPGCGSSGGTGCWADRHVVLDGFPAGGLALGAAYEPTADTGPDKGGPSLGLVLAAGPSDGPLPPLGYTWAAALADIATGTLRPRPAAPTDASATGFKDPAHSEAPDPDFTRVCAGTGLDSSQPCLAAVLAAVNHARAAEGVRPMVLPPGFGQMDVPTQVLVAVDLERVDRGLAPFAGLTDALDRNAQRGADTSNDPPDPGRAYDVVDTEWAGGSANGLDAVYGWMYDDGIDSGNLDCPKAGAPGCWGHRHGILDSFGSVGSLVMGAAVNPTGDTTSGDKGGTSIAATLAITSGPPGPLVVRWKP